MTAPQGWNTAPPIPPSPSLANHVGDLIYLRYHHLDRQQTFDFGTTDAVTVSWYVLDGRTKGEVVEEQMLSNRLLVAQLRDAEPGSIFFGRVGQQGRAYYLAPHLPQDVETINAFLARRGQQQAPQQYQQPAQQQYTPPAQPAQQQGNGTLPPASPPPMQPYGQQQQPESPQQHDDIPF